MNHPLNSMRRQTRHGMPAQMRQVQGFTLLELLIAMTIGLVILAASLLVYTSSSRGSRLSQVETQLNEDGILALNLIQQQIKQAGYSQQVIPSGSGATVLGNYSGLAVRGCDNGFTDSSAAFDSLACASGTGPAALAIRYQATTENTMPTTTGRPTNCIGNGILALTPSQVSPAPTPAPGNYALADNRYFITSSNGHSNLSCRGSEANGTANIIGTSQPLLMDVENVVIRYGVASQGSLELASTYDPLRHQIVNYLSASDIDSLAPAGAIADATQNRWSRVLSVRVCLVMRSEQTVADAPSGAFNYKACDNTDATSTDNYLRRAFTTTVLLRNRLMVQ